MPTNAELAGELKEKNALIAKLQEQLEEAMSAGTGDVAADAGELAVAQARIVELEQERDTALHAGKELDELKTKELDDLKTKAAKQTADLAAADQARISLVSGIDRIAEALGLRWDPAKDPPTYAEVTDIVVHEIGMRAVKDPVYASTQADPLEELLDSIGLTAPMITPRGHAEAIPSQDRQFARHVGDDRYLHVEVAFWRGSSGYDGNWQLNAESALKRCTAGDFGGLDGSGMPKFDRLPPFDQANRMVVLVAILPPKTQ